MHPCPFIFHWTCYYMKREFSKFIELSVVLIGGGKIETYFSNLYSKWGRWKDGNSQLLTEVFSAMA